MLKNKIREEKDKVLRKVKKKKKRTKSRNKPIKHLQTQSLPHVVNPSNTLDTRIILPRRIHPNRSKALLDGMLEDIRLGHLNEGRMWFGGFRWNEIRFRRTR